MPQLSADQARELGKCFYEVSKSLGDYRFGNWSSLSKSQRDTIESLEWTLLNYSSDFTARAIRITLNDLQSTLTRITQVTTNVNNAVRNLEQVNKIIGIAAAVVKLAASVASGNAVSIATSLDEAVTAVS